MRLLFTFLFCIIIDSFYCQEWEQLSSYNGVGRHHPITVASNNFGYMIAGQSATFSNNLDDVYRYDPNINEWTQIDPFPELQEVMAMGCMMIILHSAALDLIILAIQLIGGVLT